MHDHLGIQITWRMAREIWAMEAKCQERAGVGREGGGDVGELFL